MNESAMNGEVRKHTAHRRRIAIASLFVVVTAVTLFVLFRPERPPTPFVPATETERAVLAIADQFTQKHSSYFQVPIRIDKRTEDGTFAVAYWTPHREERLLGPRALIVDLNRNTVKAAPRE